METLTIMQNNIRSFKTNRYLLSTSLHEYSPDVILLNETNNTQNNIKMLGFNTIQKCKVNYSGTAILIRKPIKFNEIPTYDDSSLAIKIYSAIGPIIIYTHYSPPRHNHINTIPINKILNFNLPTIIIGDFNAKNAIFHNGKGDKIATYKGKQLEYIIKDRNLTFAGPDFHTYVTKTGRGKPDLILLNNKILPFHYHTTQGNFTGSDHLPIIFKISIHPIKLINNKTNLHSLDITQFKNNLKDDVFEDLQNKNVKTMDKVVDSLFENIQVATKNNSKSYTVFPMQSYVPNSKTKQKLKQTVNAFNSHITKGFPPINIINKYKNELDLIILNETKNSWNKVVEIASDNFGKPHSFWQNIHKLLNKNPKKITHLEYNTNPLTSDTSSCDSSDDEEYITDTEKARLMSKSWKKIFQPHNSQEFNNDHTKKVDSWFKDNCGKFKHKSIIDYAQLSPDHPILKPISITEYQNAIKSTKKNKAPGMSGIKLSIIQYLPPNYIKTIIKLYDAVVCTHYWPIKFKTSGMIFIPKPGKTPTNPYNYRPISLLEVIAKLFEKIITQRILYFLEHNNILPQHQFGFRSSKSTTHSIHFILETLKEYKKQHQSSLIATRDITKAFDTVWHEGLIYKINQILNLDDSFTSFIYNYLTNRSIIPHFNQVAGPAFTPKAGVPQGSCLGPIIFITYVHDLPSTIHPNTSLFQYADDLIHIVNSDTKNKNKNKIVIKKMENELNNTLHWERKWKIKTCIEKSNISFIGTTLEALNQLGGVIIENKKIPFNNPVKILGYNLTPYLSINKHIDQIVKRAKFNLAQLYRFKTAPTHIKRYLYIALIRPILEYPSVTLSQANKTNISKLQRIQNKGLRFISNVKLSDRYSSLSLHKKHNLDPVNVRLHNLSNKVLYKMRDLYLPEKEEDKIKPFNKLDPDFILDTIPMFNEKDTVARKMLDNIFNESPRTLQINALLPDINQNTVPIPRYT